jgi:hypothetical protein
MISDIIFDTNDGLIVDVTSRNEFLLVDVSEFKTFKPINNQDYDDLVLSVIRSATQKAEAYIKDFILTTNVILYYKQALYDVQVPYANPVISTLISIDQQGEETTLTEGTANDYIVLGHKYKDIRLFGYAYESLKLTGTVGLWNQPSSVPHSIKDAIKQIAKYLFSNASGQALDIQLSASSGLPIQAELLLNEFVNYHA